MKSSFISLTCWLLPCLSLRPSCPALFLPQPNTAPDKDNAKLWSPPAVICAKGIPARDFRGWGNSLLGSPFPRPSWPLVFWPHVNSWPSERQRIHGIHTYTPTTATKIRTNVCFLHFPLTTFKMLNSKCLESEQKLPWPWRSALLSNNLLFSLSKNKCAITSSPHIYMLNKLEKLRNRLSGRIFFILPVHFSVGHASRGITLIVSLHATANQGFLDSLICAYCQNMQSLDTVFRSEQCWGVMKRTCLSHL